MSLLCWNCWGLRNPQVIRELRQLVINKQPHFLFLMETKVSLFKLQRLRSSLGFEGMIQVDPVGRSGGLALF